MIQRTFLKDPNNHPDKSYKGQFPRGTFVLVHFGSRVVHGLVVKDFFSDAPHSCGRRVIVNLGSHRLERFFDCSDLIAKGL